MDFNHDEDSDGRGDKCDVCPGTADFGTDDFDLDGLDDNCDFVTILPSTPIMFDPFTSLDDEQWSTTGWELVGDAVAPIQPLAGDEGLEHASLAFTGTPWWIEAGFVSIEEWQPGDRFGVGFADAATGAMRATCEVRCIATQCDLMMIVDGLATVAGFIRPAPRITIVFGRGRAGADSLACMIGAAAVFGQTAALTLPPGVKPRLFATHRTRAAYVFAAR
jgi:hypothetical protein